jgi:hypothetical protein
MGTKLTAVEAFENARWYAASRTWAISDDDRKYITELATEAQVYA